MIMQFLVAGIFGAASFVSAAPANSDGSPTSGAAVAPAYQAGRPSPNIVQIAIVPNKQFTKNVHKAVAAASARYDAIPSMIKRAGDKELGIKGTARFTSINLVMPTSSSKASTLSSRKSSTSSSSSTSSHKASTSPQASSSGSGKGNDSKEKGSDNKDNSDAKNDDAQGQRKKLSSSSSSTRVGTPLATSVKATSSSTLVKVVVSSTVATPIATPKVSSSSTRASSSSPAAVAAPTSSSVSTASSSVSPSVASSSLMSSVPSTFSSIVSSVVSSSRSSTATSIAALVASTSSKISSSVKPAPTVYSVNAIDIQLDSEYLSPISVGSRGDTLYLVFDTGSSDLWTFSNQCGSCATSHNFYYPNLSTSFQNSSTGFSVVYGDGSAATGTVGFDTVNLAGAPISGQSIDVASSVTGNLNAGALDGILGLGWSSLSSIPGTKTPFDNMVAQGLVPSGQFGLQFIKDYHWQNAGGGGKWTFGGYDASAVSGALVSAPVTRRLYWQIKMDQVAVGSAYSYTPANDVIVDSGTTLILLDQTAVTNIYNKLPGGKLAASGHYTMWCNATDPAYTGTRNVFFTIAGMKFGVPAIDLAWYPEDANAENCFGGIQVYGGNFGILGAMFLKNVYAVFDQDNGAVKLGQRSDLAPLLD